MTSNTYSKVVAVISKKPELRQDFEIQTLLPWLRKKSQLFSQLKTGNNIILRTLEAKFDNTNSLYLSISLSLSLCLSLSLILYLDKPHLFVCFSFSCQ